MLNPKIREVLEQYANRVNEVALTLEKYATVPEFGNIIMPILIISIIGILIVNKKFNLLKY